VSVISACPILTAILYSLLLNVSEEVGFSFFFFSTNLFKYKILISIGVSKHQRYCPAASVLLDPCPAVMTLHAWTTAHTHTSVCIIWDEFLKHTRWFHCDDRPLPPFKLQRYG